MRFCSPQRRLGGRRHERAIRYRYTILELSNYEREVDLEHTVSGQSIVVISKDQISCDLTEEVAILDLKYGMYYGLNTVGTRIWKLIQEPRTVHEIRDALLEEYEVEPEHCECDVLALLHELASKGLIEIKDGTVA